MLPDVQKNTVFLGRLHASPICPSGKKKQACNTDGITMTGEKPVPAPFCPPQISHGLTRNRTLASTVEGRRFTASTTAQPLYHEVRSNNI